MLFGCICILTNPILTKPINFRSRMFVFRAKLQAHLKTQNRLFNEIAQADKFWCQYLRSTHMIYIFHYCYLLYVVTLTDSVQFLKTFFTSEILIQLSVFSITNLMASAIFTKMNRCYWIYAKLLLLDHQKGFLVHSSRMKVRR